MPKQVGNQNSRRSLLLVHSADFIKLTVVVVVIKYFWQGCLRLLRLGATAPSMPLSYAADLT